MGKLASLLDEFKNTPIGCSRDKEIREEITRITEWMKENGHLTKPFKLPKKYMKNYFPTLYFNISEKPKGLYCGSCGSIVDLTMENCDKCKHGLGCVLYNG